MDNFAKAFWVVDIVSTIVAEVLAILYVPLNNNIESEFVKTLIKIVIAIAIIIIIPLILLALIWSLVGCLRLFNKISGADLQQPVQLEIPLSNLEEGTNERIVEEVVE